MPKSLKLSALSKKKKFPDIFGTECLPIMERKEALSLLWAHILSSVSVRFYNCALRTWTKVHSGALDNGKKKKKSSTYLGLFHRRDVGACSLLKLMPLLWLSRTVPMWGEENLCFDLYVSSFAVFPHLELLISSSDVFRQSWYT